MHMELSKVNMAALSEVLSRFVDKPVMDQTELTGNYQVARLRAGFREGTNQNVGAFAGDQPAEKQN